MDPFLSVADIALIPVTVGIVEAVKRTNVLQDKFAALVSIAVGVGISFVFPAATVGLTLLAGVVIGLSASGLYAGTKSTIQG